MPRLRRNPVVPTAIPACSHRKPLRQPAQISYNLRLNKPYSPSLVKGRLKLLSYDPLHHSRPWWQQTHSAQKHLPFNGKPMIAYSIEAALESAALRVWRCRPMMKKRCRAGNTARKSLFVRPPELADDFATTGALCHAVATLLAESYLKLSAAGCYMAKAARLFSQLQASLPEVRCLYATALLCARRLSNAGWIRCAESVAIMLFR